MGKGSRTNCARRKATRSNQGMRKISFELCEMVQEGSHSGVTIESTSHARVANLTRCWYI